jgi:hypothetical protein
MKLPIINNQKIVPVRLIPIITANSIGRNWIAGILAHKLRPDGFLLEPEYEQVEVVVDDDTNETTMESRPTLFGPDSRDVEIYAYHLNEDKAPVRMLSTEWDEIYRDISVLLPKFRKEEEAKGVPDSKESTWMVDSLKILPPGVFLWREDCDKLWQAHISLPSERKDNRNLNYDAFVAPKYRNLVMEGFEEIINMDSATTCKQQGAKPNVKIQESLLKMVIAMAIDCYRFDPTAKKNTATSDIIEALEKIGLPLAENTIRTHLKNAAELLPRDFTQNSQ